MERDDNQAVRRCLAGQQAAFEHLYLAHGGWVKGYFLRCGFQDAQADDLRQEVFLRAFRSLAGFDPARGAFGAWLAAVARNAARRAAGNRRTDDFDPHLAEEMLALGQRPQEAAERNETLQAVGQCVRSLPAELGRIVTLRYVEGMTTRGIASAEAMPESTVRARLEEARQMLRRCLEGKGILG